MNHVLQHCHCTYGARIKRHDAIVNYLARNLNWTNVVIEPKFKRNDVLQKPDLLAVRKKEAIVIDVTISSEQSDLPG